MSAPYKDNKAPVKVGVRRPIKKLFSTAWSKPITPPPPPPSGYLWVTAEIWDTNEIWQP